MSHLIGSRIRRAAAWLAEQAEELEVVSAFGDAVEPVDSPFDETLISIVEQIESAAGSTNDQQAQDRAVLLLECATRVGNLLRDDFRNARGAFRRAIEEASSSVGVDPRETDERLYEAIRRKVSMKILRDDAQRLGIEIDDGQLEDLVPVDDNEIIDDGGPVELAVKGLAPVIGVSQKTLYNWRRKARSRAFWEVVALTDALAADTSRPTHEHRPAPATTADGAGAGPSGSTPPSLR